MVWCDHQFSIGFFASCCEMCGRTVDAIAAGWRGIESEIGSKPETEDGTVGDDLYVVNDATKRPVL